MSHDKPTKSVNLNLRATPALLEKIDHCRADLLRSHGSIPSRSEFVRFAVEAYVAEVESRRK